MIWVFISRFKFAQFLIYHPYLELDLLNYVFFFFPSGIDLISVHVLFVKRLVLILEEEVLTVIIIIII